MAEGTEGTIRVRFFAGARAAAGTREERAVVHPGDRLADLLARLVADRPALQRVVPACSFLLDGVSARGEAPLGAAVELDVLPPFSGG